MKEMFRLIAVTCAAVMLLWPESGCAFDDHRDRENLKKNPECKAQRDKSYLLVKEFDSSCITDIDWSAVSDVCQVRVRNSKYQVLEYVLGPKRGPAPYHCGITFVLRQYDPNHSYDEWGDGRGKQVHLIARYSTYGKDGMVLGDAEFDHAAVHEWHIPDRERLVKKLQRIEKADGNVDFDDTNDRLVIQRTYDTWGNLVREEPISSKFYWWHLHMVLRP